MSASPRAQLLVKLALNEKGEPPSEFRIFKAGANRTTKGIFEFTQASAESVMTKAADYDNDFAIDYDHAMLGGGMFSSDPAAHGAAAGWFTPEVREGELWASNVSWTPRAVKMLSDREYRYCSPAFGTTEDRTITELLNVALTNMPATKGQTPLVANQLNTNLLEAPMKSLLALLSLKETSTEADAAVALNALLAERQALLSEVGGSTVAEAVGRVRGLKAEAGKAVELAKQLGELSAASRKAEVAALLKKAVEEKKVAPAELELLTKVGERDVDELKGMLSVRSPILAQPARQPGAGDAMAGLSREEIEVAQMMGHDLEALAKSKAAGPRVVMERVAAKS